LSWSPSRAVPRVIDECCGAGRECLGGISVSGHRDRDPGALYRLSPALCADPVDCGPGDPCLSLHSPTTSKFVALITSQRLSRRLTQFSRPSPRDTAASQARISSPSLERGGAT